MHSFTVTTTGSIVGSFMSALRPRVQFPPQTCGGDNDLMGTFLELLKHGTANAHRQTGEILGTAENFGNECIFRVITLAKGQRGNPR